MNSLPSKKVVFVFVAAMIVFSWVIFQTVFQKTNISLGKNPFQITAKAVSSLPDQDNDGLFDWEEMLWGTDMNDPDTNNNGVSDGNEYTSKKNIPIVQVTDSILNYLGDVGNALAGGNSTPTLVEPKLVLEKDFYSIEVLTVVPSTKKNRDEYMDGFTKLFAVKYPASVVSDPLLDISIWIEKGDDTTRKVILAHANELESLAVELSLLRVPRDATMMHLSVVNNLYKEAQSLKKTIRVTNENPSQGFLESAKYVNYRGLRAKANVALAEYYISHNNASL